MKMNILRSKKIREGAAPKTYVLSYKDNDDTYYCTNKYGDWTTHIEDAWEGSGEGSFSDEMKRNFAEVVGAAEDDLEVRAIEKFEAKEIDARTLIAAAAKSAWSSSGATDFKLNITKLDDCVRIRAMGPKGEDNIGIWWVVSLDEDAATIAIDQYTDWDGDKKPYEQEPERTWTVKGYDELESELEDDFKALQETLDTAKQ